MSLEEIAKKSLNQFVTDGQAAAAELGKNSAAIGKSLLTTVEISERAALDIAAGTLDLEGAELVAGRAFRQTKQAFRAEGNLSASTLMDFLEGAVKTLFRLAPWLPRIS